MGALPFFNTMAKQGVVSEKVFSFKIADEGSSLFLGGTDGDLYTGDIEYHKVDTLLGYWMTSGGQISVGDKPAVTGFHTIIDTGTTIMYGSPSAVKKFYAHIPGSKLADLLHGYYSYPCSKKPDVSFSWGGKNWPISHEDFNLGETKKGSGMCVGALSGQDLGLPDGLWLLGDSFMKNVYTVFSFDKDVVGFANLK
ncbi:hypothetical protein M422DRAFT_172860 [Sphaerobolus stellatus SS14]|uniref:Unplaced genomic scaffold SPHSTscaffold_64, whole genome shotgun sequence n=1 Tax=Sphaerobolus stellatus (strain SS14) TaxID=990650 RepID=A0A0C9UDB4_SPHS4|nr:hypothetical protein M422DRAFT_172860 [Sphaerobolus stellatus SS14]